MTKGRAFAAAAAAIMFLIISQTASAQYPPPKGSLQCALAQSRVVINTNIYMTVRLIDTTGNIMVGQNVYFSVSASNGTATLSNTSGITDGNGQTSTTVFVGANPGTVELTATSDSVACRASVVVFTPPPPPPVNPCDYQPGSVACCSYNGSFPGCVRSVTIIQPPSTGDAGLAAPAGKHAPKSLYVIGGLEVAMLLPLAVWMLFRRARVRAEATITNK